MVSFSPAPSGEDGRSDLLSVVSRFGTPLYTLFLPSKVSPGPPGPQNLAPTLIFFFLFFSSSSGFCRNEGVSGGSETRSLLLVQHVEDQRGRDPGVLLWGVQDPHVSMRLS